MGDLLVSALNHLWGDWPTVLGTVVFGGLVGGLVKLVSKGGKSE
jgi:hypothetical protein